MKRKAWAGFFFMVVIPGIVCVLTHGSKLLAQAGVTWITVRDTREQAFSIDVPKGWKISGGMFRFGFVDARPYVDMTSPDGKTNIRLGDATIPGYACPNPWVPAESHGPRVASYAAGDAFSKKYGEARFSTMCQNLQVYQNHPMTPKYHPAGQGLIRITGGETIFTCSENGQPMAGYVYAETMLIGSGGPNSQWYVVALGSFLSPAAQGQNVGAMLKHTGESLHLNPDWAKMEQQRINQATQYLQGVARANTVYGDAQRAHQAKLMGMQEQQNENFNDVINGVTFTRDPWTGQTGYVQTLESGQKWVNGNHVVVTSAMSPGPAFHQLETISH